MSLPSHAFQPWTPTRTSLLFAQKKTATEERTWIDSFAAHRATIAAHRDAVLTAARKLLNPGRRTTAEQLAEHTASAAGALTALDVAVPGEAGSVTWAAKAKLEASALNPDVAAFRRTTADIHGAEYLGVIVGDVGYRRTKRAENAARNDLFRAEGLNAQGESVHLRNLNDAADAWRIVTSTSDALSALRSACLWR